MQFLKIRCLFRNTFVFYSLVILSFILFQHIVEAQSSLDNLFNEINKLKSDKDLKQASWSFTVFDVKSDSVVYKYNETTSLIPASTLKVITTATALYIVGADYKYKTYLQYDGKINKDSVLEGNIFIKGSGDPTFGYSRENGSSTYNEILEKWVSTIKRYGIKKINGSIIADSWIFNNKPIPELWSPDDYGNYYGAGSWGLNINENYYSIFFKSGNNEGDPTVIAKINPEMPDVKFTNYVKTGPEGSGDKAIIYSAPYDNNVIVKGTVPPNKEMFEVKGAIPDPPYFFANLLNQKLNNNNIQLLKPDIITPNRVAENYKFNENARITIDSVESNALSNIIYWTNLKSRNLFAETLLKTIALKQSNTSSTKEACEIVKRFWKSKGLDVSALNIFDGSGLSRENSITTKLMVDILKAIAKDTSVFNNFYQSLPIAGRTGTIAKLCKNSKAENNLRAKSGSVSGVKAYTGYVNTTDGRLLGFAMIANNYTCPSSEIEKKFERLMILLSEL